MSRPLVLSACVAGLLVFGACVFQPDLSAYPACGERGECPDGTDCWAAQGVCLPRCGEGPIDLCAPSLPDAGEPSLDAGGTGDGGHDVGGEDGGEDGGEVPDADPLRLDAVVLPAAVESEPYAPSFSARGGTPPYLYKVVEGTLPPGLGLSGESLPGAAPPAASPFTGAPDEPGQYDFTVQVTDSASPPSSDEAPFSLRVVPLLRIASPFNLPDANSGQAYEEKLVATGGSGEGWIWSVSPGHTTPGALSLDADGTLSGTTGVAGTFEVTLTDPGPGQQTRTREVRVEVVALGLTVHVRTRALPEARLGEPYDYRLSSGGGTGAHAWSIQSGALPDGISLQGDRLRGTPTAKGTTNVTLRVRDSLSIAASRAFTLTVH